jgi:hypothetical protein
MVGHGLRVTFEEPLPPKLPLSLASFGNICFQIPRHDVSDKGVPGDEYLHIPKELLDSTRQRWRHLLGLTQL